MKLMMAILLGLVNTVTVVIALTGQVKYAFMSLAANIIYNFIALR